MMRAYEIHPDRARWGKLNSIEAVHSWKLPGVHCINCGTWAITGLIYPSITTLSLGGVSLPSNQSPLSVEQFNSLAVSVQPIMGNKRPGKPGADIGPLRGRAKGRFGDFAWVNPWTPLLRESVWLALNKAGIPLVGVRAELDFGKQQHESLIEIEALPSVMLSNPPVSDKCEICGRLSMKKPNGITIATTSFDGRIPLQRIAELPTVLIANEFFAQFIQGNNLRDVIVTSIEVR